MTRTKCKENRFYRKTKIRLISLYSVVVCSLFSALICILGYNIWHIRVKGKKEAFQNNVTMIAEKLKTENIIANTWIVSTEANNNLMIDLLDNGYKLKPYGSRMPDDERKDLFDEAYQIETKLKSESEGIMILNQGAHVYYNKMTAKNQNVYNLASIQISVGYKLRTCMILQDVTAEKVYQNRLIRDLVICNLFIWIIIVGVNRWFVNKALKPVKDNNKKQIEFIASASHELKAPLAVILSCMNSIELNPDKLKDGSMNIREECRRLGKLVDDLLILASTETATWHLKIGTIDIDTLLLDIYDNYRMVFQQQGMKLEIDLGDNLSAPLQADEQRMMQAIIVLLDNALHYSKSKQAVLLKKREEHNYIYIEVIDHGIGIPLQMQKKIFDKFYQGESSLKDKTHYGLGLSIAKELIRLQGGTLSFHETKGHGATFVIKLVKGKDSTEE